MNTTETKAAYADARRTALVMEGVAYRDLDDGSEAQAAALAKAAAYMEARMNHIDSLLIA